MATTDAYFYPKTNTAYRAYFPIVDADGDLVGNASGLDSEISIDGATMADCTNEATWIASSAGSYYIELTATEMNCSGAVVEVGSTNGKPTVLTFYPMGTDDYGSTTGVNVGSVQTAVDAINAGHAQASTLTTIVADTTVIASIQTAVDAINAGHAQASTLTTIVADTTVIASIQTAVDAINAGHAQASAVSTINGYFPISVVSTVTDGAQASTVTAILADTTITASIQTAVDAINAGHAQASAVATVNGYFPISVVSTVTDGAQASTVTAILADTTITASIQTAVDAILVDTADIQPNYAQASTVAGVAQASTLTTIVADTTIIASIQVAVDAINAGHAQASALLTAAAVKVQVVSALDSDTYAEASGVPGATASIVDKLSFMATAMRNKIETTSVLITIYADDTSTTVVTSTISDDGTTFTRGEFA